MSAFQTLVLLDCWFCDGGLSRRRLASFQENKGFDTDFCTFSYWEKGVPKRGWPVKCYSARGPVVVVVAVDVVPVVEVVATASRPRSSPATLALSTTTPRRSPLKVTCCYG